MKQRSHVFLFSFFALALFSRCGGAAPDAASGIARGAKTQTSPKGAKEQAALGASCQSDDPDSICLALKYVVYQDDAGKPVVSNPDIIKTISDINSSWKQCKIGFQIDDFLPVRASDYGLRNNPANETEMNQIRKALQDDSTLLVVTTGTWDRSGSLGNTGANAWTSLPGELTYGAILEKSVGTFANIIAHEIGHYLDLLHVDDSSRLMNPIIYGSSTVLSQNECHTARGAAESYWQRMIR